MRLLLMIFGVLFTSSLAAETIGHVEYQLPNQGQGWKIVNEFDGKISHSHTVLYALENTREYLAVHENNGSADLADIDSLEMGHKFFMAHVNCLKADLANTDSIKKEIQQGMALIFPSFSAAISVIEQTDQSLLYEWSLSDEGQEKIHGWSRIFSLPNETVMLNFQTEELNELDALRPLWVQTLQDAKLIP